MPPQLVCSCVSSSLCISLLFPPWLDWERMWWAPFPGLPQGPLETKDQGGTRRLCGPMWAAGPVMVWCFWCDTQSKSWWIPPQLVLMIFQYHGDLFFQGVHCFLFSSHSIEFYFLLSFLFSCFKVGLCATQFLEAFRVLYPPHPRPVSLSMAKFKFIIFGQGPNSGFF